MPKDFNFEFQCLRRDFFIRYSNIESKLHRHNLTTLYFSVALMLEPYNYAFKDWLKCDFKDNIDENIPVLNNYFQFGDSNANIINNKIKITIGGDSRLNIPKNLSRGKHILTLKYKIYDAENYSAELIYSYSFEYDYNPPLVSLDYPNQLISTKFSNISIPVNLSVKVPDETNFLNIKL